MSDQSSGPVLFDPQELTRLRMEIGDEDGSMIRSLVESFVEDGSGQIRSVMKGLESSDTSSVVKAVHAVRGQALTFGLDALVARCAAIEHAGKTGRIADAVVLAEDLPSLFTASVQAVHAYAASFP